MTFGFEFDGVVVGCDVIDQLVDFVHIVEVLAKILVIRGTMLEMQWVEELIHRTRRSSLQDQWSVHT